MGYAIIMSPCCGCQRVCYHNPPSTVDVVRQPICLECAFRANPDGLEEVVVLPGVAYPPVDQPDGRHPNGS
jgi:hypothetical protein